MSCLRVRDCCLAVLSALCLLGFFLPELIYAQAVNVDAAKKEAKVVVYGSVPPQAMAGLNKGFEKKYGITVEYWRGDSTKVMDRALTEWRAGRPGFDVVEANRGVQLIMRKEGLLTKFIPVTSEKI